MSDGRNDGPWKLIAALRADVDEQRAQIIDLTGSVKNLVSLVRDLLVDRPAASWPPRETGGSLSERGGLLRPKSEGFNWANVGESPVLNRSGGPDVEPCACGHLRAQHAFYETNLAIVCVYSGCPCMTFRPLNNGAV